MSREGYVKMLRGIAIVTALVMWVVSNLFSIDGFSIQMPGKEWMGVMLALCITAIELIWNEEGRSHNLTLLVVGLLAYTYGVFTNVAGIVNIQRVDLLVEPWKIVFPFVLGFFLEITPEALFMWGLIGVVHRDFLGQLAKKGGGREVVTRPESSQVVKTLQQMQGQGYRPTPQGMPPIHRPQAQRKP